VLPTTDDVSMLSSLCGLRASYKKKGAMDFAILNIYTFTNSKQVM